MHANVQNLMLLDYNLDYNFRQNSRDGNLFIILMYVCLDIYFVYTFILFLQIFVYTKHIIISRILLRKLQII